MDTSLYYDIKTPKVHPWTKHEQRASDAILDVCTFHRRDYDEVLIYSTPGEMQLVSESLQDAFKNPPTASIGLLGRLPEELMRYVLDHLDLISYFHFRQINRQARVVATGRPEYRAITKHGLEGLRAMLRSGLGEWCHLDYLYSRLTHETCVLCVDFAVFLFLPEMTRCCLQCLRYEPDFRMIGTSALAKAAHISLKRLHRLVYRKVRTVPGSYSLRRKAIKCPEYIAATRPATEVLVCEGVIEQFSRWRAPYQKWDEDLRFMASVALPWYDPGSDEVDRGVCCKACNTRDQRKICYDFLGDHVYSRYSYMAHFEECEGAQELWKKSEEGTKPVEDSSFIRNGGYDIGTKEEVEEKVRKRQKQGKDTCN